MLIAIGEVMKFTGEFVASDLVVVSVVNYTFSTHNEC